VQPDYDLDWHPAPRRQYIINLDAGVQITASDGEARVIARLLDSARQQTDGAIGEIDTLLKGKEEEILEV
jgi:arginine repressor